MTVVASRHQVPLQVSDVASTISDMRAQIHGFAELSVLAAHYNGELCFPESWKADLLTVTGEHGRSVAARLGQPEDASLHVLSVGVNAGIGRWVQRAADPMLDDKTKQAARTLVLSYERLALQIELAIASLKTTGL
jgi:hypothetical protein